MVKVVTHRSLKPVKGIKRENDVVCIVSNFGNRYREERRGNERKNEVQAAEKEKGGRGRCL